MKLQNILISQPEPPKSSSYSDIITKYGVNIDFNPFFRVEPVTVKEFRLQNINVLEHTAIVFSAKSTIDAFFNICEDMRITIPETMKYFCTTEAIALYLQKHIVYRKRKIFFGNGKVDSIITSIGTKHKNETFLIATTDTVKPDIFKLFTKAKLKYHTAVFCKTTNSDLHTIDFSKYQMMVFYSPLDVKSLYENYPDFQQNDMELITFGPLTAKAVADAGLKAVINAPTPEVPSVAQAITTYLEKE